MLCLQNNPRCGEALQLCTAVGSCGVVPNPAPCDQQLAVPLQALLGIPCAQWGDKGSQKGKQRSVLQGLSGTHFTPHEASYHSRPAAIIESQYCLLHQLLTIMWQDMQTYSDTKKLPQHSRQLKANFFTLLHLFKTFSIFAAHSSSRASSSTLLDTNYFCSLAYIQNTCFIIHSPLTCF